MNVSPVVVIIVSVCCSAVAQILLKTGMSQESVQLVLMRDSGTWSMLRVLIEPWIIGGLVLYAIGAFIWLFALAQVEVSFAYPFVGLGFILVMLLGLFFLDDAVSPMRAFGTLLVVAGVVLISRT